jgi:GNAT superfamily N-acetyltransferase
MALRDADEVIGGCGYAFVSAEVAQVGYIVARRHWGRGFATEALEHQLEAARSVEPFRVTAAVHAANTASLRVLDKCGFVPDDPPTTRSEFPNLGTSGPQRTLCFWRMAGRPVDAGGSREAGDAWDANASNQEAR